MEQTLPLVSVIIPTHNAQDFIREAVESVLGQTYSNLELIVVDDCATDNTPAILASIDDPRLTVVRHAVNGHVCAARNTGMSHAKGKYIAFLDADDAWMPTKLEKQIGFLEQNPAYGSCFTWGMIVNEQGEARIPDEHSEFDLQFLYKAFHEENRSHADWFLRFLRSGNCMLTSSSVARKSLIDEIGEQNVALRQLQDYDYWLRLLCKAPQHIVCEELTRYRRTDGGESLSTQTEPIRIRTNNEEIWMHIHLFDTMDDELFRSLFRDRFVYPEASSPAELACEKAFLLKESGMGTAPYLSHMHNLIANPETRQVLRDTYHYTQQDYYRENTAPIYYDRAMAEDLQQTKQLLTDIYNSRYWKLLAPLRRLLRK